MSAHAAAARAPARAARPIASAPGGPAARSGAASAQARFGNAGTAVLLAERQTVRPKLEADAAAISVMRMDAGTGGGERNAIVRRTLAPVGGSKPGQKPGAAKKSFDEDGGGIGGAVGGGIDLIERVATENSLTMAALRLLIPDAVLARLRDAVPALRYAAQVLRNPAPFFKLLHAAIGRRIVDSVKEATSFIAGLVPSSPNFDGKACVEAQLNLALKEIHANWWDLLRSTVNDVINPLPGVGADSAAMWQGLKHLWRNLSDGDYDAAADDFLLVSRHHMAAAGRLYPWFAVVALIVGAFTGPVFAAVAAVVEEVGAALIIATLAVEAVSIGKAAANIARPTRSPALKECDCRIIAQSGLTVALMGAFSLLGMGAKLLVQTIVKRVSFLWKGPKVRTKGKANSPGDIMARRFALSLRLKSASNRFRVAITDRLGLGPNFPGIDITLGSKLTFKVRGTGEILSDLAAVQKALAEGKRLDLTIDRGEVFQVKSYSKGKGDAARQKTIFDDISKEMGKFAQFEKGKTYFGPQHNVVLTNIERRSFVVFLQKDLPPDLMARLQVLADGKGVTLQPIVGAVPPGHPSLIPAESLPKIFGQLGEGGADAATEPARQPKGSDAVECSL
jgi:hypothetical protein